MYEFTCQCHSQTIPSVSGDSQGQETCLVPSSDEQTGNYDKRVL